MKSVASIVVIAACVFGSYADQTSFDCVWRKEVLSFAAYIHPHLTIVQAQEIADALNGADNTAPGCHVSPPASAAKLPSTPLRLQPYHARQAVAASILGASKMLERMPTGIEGTFTIYADAQNGNDANPGTSDKPVETVARGVELTRGAQAGQPRSLVLRTGYYSVTTTVEIGPQDSGLSIINDEGANAVVSGAAPLSVDWEPYKVGPDPIYPSGQRQWLYRDDTSAVGAAPKAGGAIVANGTTSTWQECEANCQATPTCNVWSFLGRSGKQCWFRTDDVYQPTQFYGDTSGYLTPPSPSLPPANIWRADLSPMVAAGLIPNPTALTVRVSSGRRGIRGRFPNADPETDGFASALEADSWGVPNTPVNPVIEYNPPFPFRNNSGQFSQYQLGIGGPCEHFNPPAGYWCGNHTSGGGAFTYRVPSGFVVDETILPHFPNYTNPTGAIVQTWRPGHWSSWAFQVDTFNLSTGQLNFSHGGFQGARGDDTGDNFYIAGVLEEVDTGAEYFYDAATSSLFLFHNSTGAPPSAKGSPQGSFPEVAIGGANSLFRIVGTKEVPVVNITISGLVLRDGGETLLNQSLHGMPSGGDWALTRNGVVYAEGTEGFGLFDCEFERNDGNDVMLFGYNLKPTVAANQFAWTGETCIALWGKTSGAPGGAMAEGMGPDGTAGEQPTNTLVAGNLAREFGVWEKQSSFFFQAKTGTTTLLRNIAFNGPRANVNFNDGFRGGNNLTSNLIFNSCRESGDHGPFNSWDRQVYEWIGADGNVTSTKDFDQFQHNMIMGGYSADEAIDNDDGSRRFLTTYNAFYGTKSDLKSDFSGNQNYHYNNVLCYIGEGFHAVGAIAGLEDRFVNSTLVLNSGGSYGSGQCSAGSGQSPVLVGNNSVYTQDGTLSECGVSLQQWQAQGHDLGTTVAVWPQDDDLITQVRAVLYV